MQASTALRTVALCPAVGEEVQGIDLSRPLHRDIAAQLVALLGERGMIFARGQDLTPDSQLEVARIFGEVHVNPFFPAVPGHPQVAEIRKEPEQVHAVGETWHTDNSYDAAPALGSALYARVMPPSGGDTLFISMYAVYDALSDGLKDTLGRLRAVHSTAHVFGAGGSRARKKLDTEAQAAKAGTREAEHPVVVTHPVSGRKLLYVNPGFTTHIAGWTQKESAALLGFLYEHAQRPDFQCRLHWEVGTIAIWDNRSTWHYAVNDYHGHRRVMHRVQIAGVPLQ